MKPGNHKWTLQEEVMVCNHYFNHKKDYKQTVSELMAQLCSIGSDLTEEKAMAKLNNYSSREGGSRFNHCSKASVAVFNALNELYGEDDALSDLLRYIKGKYSGGSYVVSEGYDDCFDLPYVEPGLSFSTSASPSMSLVVTKSVSEKGFIATLFDLLNRDGRDNSKIYGSVDMDRRTFNKIIGGKSISKENIFKLIVALKLDYQDAVDLLSKANLGFNPNCWRDIVIMSAIEQKDFDTFGIDDALHECREKTMFSIE